MPQKNLKKIPLNSSVGILGGGQLARMLAHSAQRLGLQVHILAQDSHEPAAQVTPFVHSSLDSLCEQAHLISFESEFFDTGPLQKFARSRKIRFFPNLEVITAIRDRKPQKELLRKFNIPTAAFVSIQSLNDLFLAYEKFPSLVLKKRRGGYDGYGTFVLKNEKDKDQFFSSKDFLAKPNGFIAEAFIPFDRELACIFVRSSSGQKAHLPLVFSQQTNSRCDYVLGPTEHPRWPSMLKKIFNMMDAIDYVGCLGVEFFAAGQDLLVNELAPRVHNSGHYSMDALNFSQFDLHWIAGLDLPLPKLVQGAKAFAMVNVLGQSSTRDLHWKGSLEHFYWYGKEDSRPGRKMGHVNVLASDQKELLAKVRKIRRGVGL